MLTNTAPMNAKASPNINFFLPVCFAKYTPVRKSESNAIPLETRIAIGTSLIKMKGIVTGNVDMKT